MYRQTFSVVEAPRSHLLECEGDVAAEGWEEAFWLEERILAFPPLLHEGGSEVLTEVEEGDIVFSLGGVLGK